MYFIEGFIPSGGMYRRTTHECETREEVEAAILVLLNKKSINIGIYQTKDVTSEFKELSIFKNKINGGGSI